MTDEQCDISLPAKRSPLFVKPLKLNDLFGGEVTPERNAHIGSRNDEIFSSQSIPSNCCDTGGHPKSPVRRLRLWTILL